MPHFDECHIQVGIAPMCDYMGVGKAAWWRFRAAQRLATEASRSRHGTIAGEGAGGGP